MNARIQCLAKIGETGRGGITRSSLSPEYMEAQSRVIEWMRKAGMEARVDPVGNLIGTLPGQRRSMGAIVVGSHIDTVPNGGAYDGSLGVLAGIEVAATLQQQNVQLRHPLEVVAFVEEESTRWGMSLMGSSGMAGTLKRDEIFRRTDECGISIAEALRSVGLDPERYADAKRSPDELAFYLELHIEQGAVLDSLGLPLGVVTGIAAPVFLAVTLKGKAGHAGATPMGLRQDALVVAAELVLAAKRVAEEASPTSVATVGRCEVSPGATNVIPGEVYMTFDIRDMSLEARERMVDQIKEAVAVSAIRHGVSYEITELARGEPITLPEFMVDLVSDCMDELNFPVFRLPSGASHDAQVMAQLVDTAMIFVRSKGGISHSPHEYSAPEDIAMGAEALYRIVLALDDLDGVSYG